MKTPSLVVAVLVLLFSSVILVFAADPSPSPIPLIVTFPGVSETSAARPSEYISIFYRFTLIFGALLAMAVIVFGAIEYTLTAGNVGKQEDAKDRIRNAVLGLALLLSTVFILYTINPKILDLEEPEVSGRDLPPPPPAGVQPAAPTNLQVWYNDPVKYRDAYRAGRENSTWSEPYPIPPRETPMDHSPPFYVFRWLWADPRCNVGGATNISLDHYDLQKFVGVDNSTGQEHWESLFVVNRRGRCPEPAGTAAEEWLVLFTTPDNNARYANSSWDFDPSGSTGRILAELSALPMQTKWGVNAVSTNYIYSPGSNIVLNPIGKPRAPRVSRADRPSIRLADLSNNEAGFLLQATTQNVSRGALNLDPSAWQPKNDIHTESLRQDHDLRNTNITHTFPVDDFMARGSPDPGTSNTSPYTYLRIIAFNGAGDSDPDPNRDDIVDIRPWYAARLRVTMGAAGGTVTITSPVSSLMNCPPTCTVDLRVGDIVTLNAVPSPGFQLLGWIGCDEVEATFTCVKTMSGGGSEEVVAPSFAPE